MPINAKKEGFGRLPNLFPKYSTDPSFIVNLCDYFIFYFTYYMVTYNTFKVHLS